jgi:hypothetical protein
MLFPFAQKSKVNSDVLDVLHIVHMYSKLQRFGPFLRKLRVRPFDICKIRFKETFIKYIFRFFEPFRARLALKKVLI